MDGTRVRPVDRPWIEDRSRSRIAISLNCRDWPELPAPPKQESRTCSGPGSAALGRSPFCHSRLAVVGSLPSHRRATLAGLRTAGRLNRAGASRPVARNGGAGSGELRRDGDAARLLHGRLAGERIRVALGGGPPCSEPHRRLRAEVAATLCVLRTRRQSCRPRSAGSRA